MLKVNFLGEDIQKLEHYRQTDRQADRQTRPNTLRRRIRGNNADEYVNSFYFYGGNNSYFGK